MGEQARATIKDVAKAAGVSFQTVSRVLNQRPDVAAQTRRRVLDVIDRLGYRPSALARSLVQQRSCTLGVVTAGLKYIGGPGRALNGITRRAAELGYTLLLQELSRFDLIAVEPLVHALLAQQVDGIIWAVPEVGSNHQWLSAPGALPVPFVFVSTAPRPSLPVVCIDNFAGAQLAVRHLLQQGYRHIGHISGPEEWWEAQQRRLGWQGVLAEAGLPAEACEEGNWSSASGAQAMRRLLDQFPHLDAVFAANDQMALGALLAVAQGGRKVPQFGVVGFDGLPEAAYYLPPLTTILQDQQALGMCAVEEVVRLVEAKRQGLPAEPRCTILQPALVIRQSTDRTNSLPPLEI